MSLPVERGAPGVGAVYSQDDHNSPTTSANHTSFTGASGHRQYTGSGQNPSVPASEFHTNPTETSRGATVGTCPSSDYTAGVIDVVTANKDYILNALDDDTTIELISTGLLPTTLIKTLAEDGYDKKINVFDHLFNALKVHPKQGWNTLIGKLYSPFHRDLKEVLIDGIEQKFVLDITSEGIFNKEPEIDSFTNDEQLTAAEKTIICHLSALVLHLQSNIDGFCDQLVSQFQIDWHQREHCTLQTISPFQQALRLLNILIKKQGDAQDDMYFALVEALNSEFFSQEIAQTLSVTFDKYNEQP